MAAADSRKHRDFAGPPADAVFGIFPRAKTVVHQVQADCSDEEGDRHHVGSHAGTVVGDRCCFDLVRDDRFGHHRVGVFRGIDFVQSGAAIQQFCAEFICAAQQCRQSGIQLF
ncbi:hypothetical protein SDC9_202897 [bioreactor metagenome]|uniref:Uncharacterized protein n=1 Tax=bioreactor metagenome TaxID=1076179 RepID=A0A645IUY3_9ZZZZ